MPLSDQTRKEYASWGAALPSTDSHGTEDEIMANMKRLMPTRWRQEGNKLIGHTELGEVVNFIPTDMMLRGTDDKGLPILEKLVL